MRNRESEQHPAVTKVTKITQIKWCPCPGSCDQGCHCRKARLECGSGCGCGGKCSNSHLERVKQARVGPSPVHKQGCFAKEVIHRNDVIGEYSGAHIMPLKSAEATNPDNLYLADLVVETKRNMLVMDGETEGSAVTRANDQTEKKANSKFETKYLRVEDNSRLGIGLFLVATKEIGKDEEIFVDYGSNYPKPWLKKESKKK